VDECKPLPLSAALRNHCIARRLLRVIPAASPPLHDMRPICRGSQSSTFQNNVRIQFDRDRGLPLRMSTQFRYTLGAQLTHSYPVSRTGITALKWCVYRDTNSDCFHRQIDRCTEIGYSNVDYDRTES